LNDIDDPVKDAMTLLREHNNPGYNYHYTIYQYFELVELTKEDSLLGFNPFIETESMITTNLYNAIEIELADAIVRNYISFGIVISLSSEILQYKRKVFNVLELQASSEAFLRSLILLLALYWAVYQALCLRGTSEKMLKRQKRNTIASKSRLMN
jgi:hypothetical protein